MAELDWPALRARIARAEEKTAELLSPSVDALDRVLEDRARRLAVRHDVDRSDEIELAFFTAGGEAFAVDSRGVQSVMPVADLEAMPHTPPVFRGVVSHRGDVLPVVDLGALLSGTRSGVGERCVLVLGLARPELGVLVDEAERIGRLRVSEVERARIPTSLQSFAFVRGVHEGHRLVIDVETLLQDPRLTL